MTCGVFWGRRLNCARSHNESTLIFKGILFVYVPINVSKLTVYADVMGIFIYLAALNYQLQIKMLI